MCLAIGGSTNAVLHLTALAYEAEAPLNVLDTFDKMAKTTPTLVKVYPAGTNDMEAFWRAGGIPRVIENLKESLHMDVRTCTGRTMQENIDAFEYRFAENRDVIRDTADPFSTSGGLAVLRGKPGPQNRHQQAHGHRSGRPPVHGFGQGVRLRRRRCQSHP